MSSSTPALLPKDVTFVPFSFSSVTCNYNTYNYKVLKELGTRQNLDLRLSNFTARLQRCHNPQSMQGLRCGRRLSTEVLGVCLRGNNAYKGDGKQEMPEQMTNMQHVLHLCAP